MTIGSARVALVSVTNKTGVIEFARGLAGLSFRILSTGGTAKILRDAGLDITDVSEVTRSPEILGGRVKTLHPVIHGGILADRDNIDHLKDMRRLDITGIDLVVANLYDFAGDARAKNLPLAKAIEHIDIGGPTMLRAAAKNHVHCMPVIDPSDYNDVLNYWKSSRNDLAFRQRLAAKVFATTAAYDRMISDYFADSLQSEDSRSVWPKQSTTKLELLQTLRYGENSHQAAALYRSAETPVHGLASAKILQGKELSYNNYVDLDAAAAIVADLAPLPSVTIIKHTNPCGTAASPTLSALHLFERALSCDPKCAFGGIVASNITVDESAAKAMAEIFLECIIAPDYTAGALQVFANKKNLRVVKSDAVLESGRAHRSAHLWKSINGALLTQEADAVIPHPETWNCVTKMKPDATMLADLAFAMTVCKHVKSNAIVLSSGLRTIGVGAGQMSRVDSARFAIDKAREMAHEVPGSVMASDAFFPFRDTVDFAAKSGVKAIVQPGGSLRDQESVDAANEHGLVMMTTGVRHFRH
jgi:phosphoribosylaminoimidazolecarboxamide formyltransferase/IMP cyclohydrolase